MGKKSDYTVIGFWADTDQIFISHVTSDNPYCAVKEVATELIEESSGSPNDLLIVEIIEGHHASVNPEQKVVPSSQFGVVENTDEDKE